MAEAAEGKKLLLVCSLELAWPSGSRFLGCCPCLPGAEVGAAPVLALGRRRRPRGAQSSVCWAAA